MARRVLVLFLSISFALDAFPQAAGGTPPQRTRRRSPIESTVFLGNWWDYYNRATRRIDSGDLSGAESDLREALEFRPDDDSNARAYGVRFQEYYPNYELGLILYDTGRYEEALRRLEASLATSPLEETLFYIHESRRRVAAAGGLDREFPVLVLEEPPGPVLTPNSSILVKGRASDDLYVDVILAGGVSVPVEPARSNTDFEVEIPLDRHVDRIPVTVIDLVGNRTTREIEVRVDREGPALSLQSLHLLPDGETASLEGVVSDPNGIAAVEVGGAPVPIPEEAIEIRLEGEFPVSPETGKVRLDLRDRFGNGTVVELDPKLRVGAAEGGAGRIQLAALALDARHLAAAAPRGPDIDIAGIADGRRVYSSEVYVDGWVSDGSGVESIACNGNDLSFPRGKEVYFSYHWGGLKEGTNTLEVRAANVQGVENRERLDLVCDVPTRLDPGERLALVVSDLSVAGVSTDLSASRGLVESSLNGAFIERDRFDVLAYGEDLVDILREREVGSSRLASRRNRAPDRSLRIPDLILSGGIQEYRGFVLMDLEVRSVQAGRVLAAFSVGTADRSPRSIRETAAAAALKVEQRFPLVQGDVIDVLPRYVRSNLSRTHGIERDYQLLGFRKIGEEVSSTGRSLGIRLNPIGPLTVLRVQSDYSDLQPEPERTSADLVVGDLVVTR